MQKVVDFIRELYQTEAFIPLHEPRFYGNEKRYLNECIDSTFVSSVGTFVDRFELEFANYVGSDYAIACVNGTSALHIALLLADVNEEHEVITQALSFVATSNAIAYCRAQPIFLDVDLETLGLSPKSLRQFLESHCEVKDAKCFNKTTKKRVKACVAMHTFGHPCRIDEIAALCKEWHITLVEDAAESLGSHYKAKHTGTFGEFGVFSFNGNKIITSGGGGVLVTNNKTLAQKAKHLTTTAKVPHPWEYVHDEIAFNYRMPNLNAALLVAQMENLEHFLQNKRELAQMYQKFFNSIADFLFIKEPQHATSNYWLNAVLCQDTAQRDAFLEYCNAHGVMVRPIWTLLSELKMFRKAQKDDLKNSLFLQNRVVNLPSSVRV
jgi:aminotransferase in exopolysaccharide biosynthesis